MIETELVAAEADAAAVPADYDGDGCLDIGLKGSNGIWYIDLCENGFGRHWDFAYTNYGNAAAIPVPADYDGDGRIDLAVRDSIYGAWLIDYQSNGFGVFDVEYLGYGYTNSIPVPADYDGDGKADLSVKDSYGFWGIDYAADGFGAWNVQRTGYGDSSSIPVPANYDGDVSTLGFPKADLAIKNSDGQWKIDFSKNGFGGPCLIPWYCIRPQWDLELTGYGYSNAIPIPADYDGDGMADLAVKDTYAGGSFLIDRAYPGTPSTSPSFGYWDNEFTYGYGYGTPVPGNYTPQDQHPWIDLAVKDNTTGHWRIDKAVDGYWEWGIQLDNVGRPLVEDITAPHIVSTRVFGPSR